ncbi:myelin protein zero-like protein 2 [Cetorhinus maximus]
MCLYTPAWILLLAVTLTGVFEVGAIEIYTGGSVEARNGSEQRLRCTFRSSAPVSKQTTVTWQFWPLENGNGESIFYYLQQPYPPTTGRFKGRVAWSGDIWKKDASIIVSELQFTDNGTFHCTVMNPPDVHGVAGEIKLRVVHKGLWMIGVVLG